MRDCEVDSPVAAFGELYRLRRGYTPIWVNSDEPARYCSGTHD